MNRLAWVATFFGGLYLAYNSSWASYVVKSLLSVDPEPKFFWSVIAGMVLFSAVGCYWVANEVSEFVKRVENKFLN